MLRSDGRRIDAANANYVARAMVRRGFGTGSIALKTLLTSSRIVTVRRADSKENSMPRSIRSMLCIFAAFSATMAAAEEEQPVVAQRPGFPFAKWIQNLNDSNPE